MGWFITYGGNPALGVEEGIVEERQGWVGARKETDEPTANAL